MRKRKISISMKNILLVVVVISMIMGIVESLTFGGYLSNIFIVCVLITHGLIFYILSTRSLSDVFKTGNKLSSKVSKKKLDYEIEDFEDLSKEELLQMERELFRITIEQKVVPKKINEELKGVRAELRSRGLEGAYD